MLDAVRLAVGTLTRLPISAPVTLNRRVAGGAMILSPLIGGLLAVPVGALAALAAAHSTTAGSAFVISAIAIGAIAYLTRGIHLDGLADTADALGSDLPAPQALEVARRSDIGPFGVVTLVLVLLTQVAAYAALVSEGQALLSLVFAVGSARLALPVACARGIPAARPDGLGAGVAGSVPIWAAAGVVIAWTAAVAAASATLGSASAIGAVVTVVGILAICLVVVRTALTRFGGITGDVLGAAVELSFAIALVILVA